MKTGLLVADVMTRKPTMVVASTTIADAARLMKERRVGTLLAGSAGALLGILSEQDIVHNIVAEGSIPSEVLVEEVMVTNVHTIGPGADIFEALSTMRQYDIRHLPVVEEGELLGLLTLKDILKFQPQLFDLLVEQLDVREEDKPRSRKW